MPQRLAGAFLVVSTLLASTSVSAQTGADFDQTHARVGDFLFVNDPDRRVEISGHVTSVSDQELIVDGYRFAPKPGLKVERSGDTIWDAQSSDSCSVASPAPPSARRDA